MAQNDWASVLNSLGSAVMRSGPAAGLTPPAGGGTFVFGFHTIVEPVNAGAAALYLNVPNFNPVAYTPGGSPGDPGGGMTIDAWIRRGPSASLLGYSPFLFVGCQQASPPDITDEAYLLGIEDAEAPRIVLRKGRIIDGIPAATSGNSLRRSVGTVEDGEWVNLRLEMIVNRKSDGTAGDVVVRAYRNTVALPSSPVWTPVPFNDSLGDYLVDDTLAVNTGSAPYISGFMGFGMAVADGAVARRAFFDHIRAARQLI